MACRFGTILLRNMSETLLRRDYKVSGDEIKITRKNAVGRNLIDILKYRLQNGELNFIEHLAPSTKDRAISISFEAKVTGDPINLFVILHKYRNHSWYRYGWVQIAGSDWQRFHMVRKVDANTDLTVQIQEKDFQGNNTQYEIRKLCRRRMGQRTGGGRQRFGFAEWLLRVERSDRISPVTFRKISSYPGTIHFPCQDRSHQNRIRYLSYI